MNFNQAGLLRECLDSLAEAMGEVSAATETIVVDNGSIDGSVEMVRADFPRVRLIELPDNLGFAGGVVQGIRAARGEWVFCVNNDAVVTESAIAELLRVADHCPNDVGSIAALMVFADRPNVINSAGIEVDHLGVAWDRLLGQSVASAGVEVTEVFGASAGAAFTGARCWMTPPSSRRSSRISRMSMSRGERECTDGVPCVLPERGLHQFSATSRHGSPLKYYWSGRNRLRLLARNATLGQLLRYGLAMLAFDFIYVFAALVTDRSVAPIRGSRGVRHWREIDVSSLT